MKRQPPDRVKLAMLLDELARHLAAKAKRLDLLSPVGYARGTLCTQVLGMDGGRLLLIYEAGYRATIYPRAAYVIGGEIGNGHLDAVRAALRLERASKTAFVALKDWRPAMEVPWGSPSSYAAWTSDDHRVEATSPPEAVRMARRERAGWLFAHNQNDAEAHALRESATEGAK